MPLAGFTVEKYRSFVRPAKVELRPLTLLFGYNSAGKSSLLRTLPLLAASMDPNAPGPLALGSEVARGATFADIKSHQVAGSIVSFGLEWNERSGPISKTELRIFDVEDRKEQVVERIRAFDPAGSLVFEAEWDLDGKAAGGPGLSYMVRFPPPLDKPVPQRIEFAGLLPLRLSDPPGPPVSGYFWSLREQMNDLRNSVHWIGSLRAMPSRRADYIGRPKSMGPTGKEAVAILAYDKRGQGSILRRVSAWYQSATRHSLDIIEEAGRFSVVLSPLKGAPVNINLVDTGEGMAQVLPVLVLGVQAIQGELGADAVLAIEHPELHLHPAAERELASFFCELARQEEAPRTLIETHSENFLLRVQLAIVRGEIPREHVLVYWVRELEDGSSEVERITFDELGRPEGNTWPPGVFSEDVEQARQIVLERRNRSRT